MLFCLARKTIYSSMGRCPMLVLKTAVTMNVYSMPSAFTEALRELNVPFALRDGCKSNSGVQVHVNLKDAP